VYVPVAAELRSRFWLIPPADFDQLEGHVVRYFSLLLIEALVDGLILAQEFDRHHNDKARFGIDENVVRRIVQSVADHVAPEAHIEHYSGVLHLRALQTTIRLSRFAVWQHILDKKSSPTRPNAQLIFDVCSAIRDAAPFLAQRRICFLVDDYSNQRIPAALQMRLNQAITFARQGSAIFKVSSEYEGVALDGIQQGREVVEVNVGYEYVSLAGRSRDRFLQNMLERRFEYLDSPIRIVDILGRSGLAPALVLAREIRKLFEADKEFYYNGIDTISDLCSGDFAMGLQLVRTIFRRAGVDWRSPAPIPPHIQHAAITGYASEEFEYLQYHTVDGRTVHEIADRLAWLSRECILRKEALNGDPVIKNHLDISEKALGVLAGDSPALRKMVDDLVRRGVLFPMEQSRAREGRDGTRRYMLRRILLARYPTALGRHTPIKFDDVERLKHLLTDPRSFAIAELDRTGSGRRLKTQESANQRRLHLQMPEEGDGA
jgi:hypothetical protein